MCNEYNGWKNYQRWSISLWLDYELFTHFRFVERAKELDVYDLAKEIEEYIRDENPLIGDASTFSDLLGAALSSVDWYAVAEGFK